MQMRPCGLLHALPLSVRLQPEIKKPFGLLLVFGDAPDNFLAYPFGKIFGVYIAGETVFVVLVGNRPYVHLFFLHGAYTNFSPLDICTSATN